MPLLHGLLSVHGMRNDFEYLEDFFLMIVPITFIHGNKIK